VIVLDVCFSGFGQFESEDFGEGENKQFLHIDEIWVNTHFILIFNRNTFVYWIIDFYFLFYIYNNKLIKIYK